MRTRVAALALLNLAMLGSPARATDLMIRQRVIGAGPKDAPPREERQYLTATKRVTDAADSRMIIDLDARTMTVANKTRKTFHVLTFADIRAQTDAMRARLEQLPPEVRKSIGDMDGDVAVKGTGKEGTIAGHPAKEFTVTSGMASGAVWITEDFVPPGDVKAWQDAMDTMSGPNGPGGKLATALVKMHGIPLRSTFTTAMGPTRFTVTTEVLDVAAGAPPAEVLTVPADYKQDAMPALPPTATPKSAAPKAAP